MQTSVSIKEHLKYLDKINSKNPKNLNDVKNYWKEKLEIKLENEKKL